MGLSEKALITPLLAVSRVAQPQSDYSDVATQLPSALKGQKQAITRLLPIDHP